MKKVMKQREASKTARRKINKRKYYGVKVNERKYRKDIYNTFYDRNLLKRSLKKGPVQGIADYFVAINRKLDSLLRKAISLLTDSYDKGTKRLLDKDGNTVELGDPTDTLAIDTLIGEQQTYYVNLTRAQSQKVNKIIAKGLEDGTSTAKIASQINVGVKKVSQRRATNIAKSEIVKSHNLGQNETMRQAGIKEYNYITSDDSKVSDICKKNQGPKSRPHNYKVAQAGTADNPLPVINSHPGCRCTTVIADRIKK